MRGRVAGVCVGGLILVCRLGCGRIMWCWRWRRLIRVGGCRVGGVGRTPSVDWSVPPGGWRGVPAGGSGRGSAGDGRCPVVVMVAGLWVSLTNRVDSHAEPWYGRGMKDATTTITYESWRNPDDHVTATVDISWVEWGWIGTATVEDLLFELGEFDRDEHDDCHRDALEAAASAAANALYLYEATKETP